MSIVLVIFVAFFLLTPICTYGLLRVAGERINRVSIVNVTTLALLLFSILGTFPLFFHFNEYQYSIGVQDRNAVLLVLLYSSLNIFMFLAGVIFVRQVVGLRSVPFISRELKSLTRVQIGSVFFLFAACVLVLLYYLRQLDDVAVYVLFTDGQNAATVARSNMGNAFPGNYHWYKLIMADIGSIVAFALFAVWLNRKTRSSFALFFASFVYSVFVSVMATEKAPLVWFLVGLFMVYFVIKNDGCVPYKKAAYLPISLLLILICLYVVFMGVDGVSNAVSSVFSRAFAGSVSPAYFYLEFFPHHQGYLFGQTFPNPGGIFPFEPYAYTTEVMNWVHPELSKEGIVGSMPTVFWGEAYANFGVIGIPVVGFLMGLFVAIFSYMLSKVEMNPISIGAFVWAVLYFKNLAVTGFSGYLYSVNLLFVLVVVSGLLFMKGRVGLRS